MYVSTYVVVQYLYMVFVYDYYELNDKLIQLR